MAAAITEIFSPNIATPARRQVGWWLLAIAALVFGMVMLGGVTRLTNSGLSMVEWRPVTGWLPPLSEEAWLGEFEKYRAFPEYQKINRGMQLADFKGIYWWEYSHRLMGRLIGLAFAIPFAFFLLSGRLDRALGFRLAGLFALGAAQGALGWFMVQSGLVDHPDVSHYRLTAHLGLAVLIFGACFWTALDCLRPDWHAPPQPALRRNASLVLAAIFLQILSGGFVAGLNAGFIYNTWPLMDGGIWPQDLWRLSPWWLNPLENLASVQFNHRVLAYIVCIAVGAVWLQARRSVLASDAALGVKLLLAALVVQFILGLATLLLVVPVPLAAAHQAGALLLLAAALYFRHTLRAPA